MKQFNAGKRAEAIAGIMNWSKPKEIIGRRRKEQSLFATGLYSGDGFGTVYPASSSGAVQWSKGKRVDLRKEYGGIPPLTPAQPHQPPQVPKPAPTPQPSPAPAQGGFWAWVLAWLRA